MEIKKKILIISASFYPKNSPRSFRTTELVKEFCRMGHEVTLLAPVVTESLELSKSFSFSIIDLSNISWPVISSRIPLAGKFNRLLSWALEYPKIQYVYKLFKLRNKLKGFDLLISIAVPYTIHWGVASIWRSDRRIAKIWVADCGDPYMGQKNDSFPPPFYFAAIERWFMNKADFISIPTEYAKKAYYDCFHNKIKIIPQGFKFSDVPICHDGINEIRDCEMEFAYAGSLIPGKRFPVLFFEHLISLNNEYKFYIYTNQHSLLKIYEERSNGRIILKDTIPRTNLLQELCSMDFLVNFENAGEVQQPSKIIDYALLNKPILSVSTLNYNPSGIERFLIRDFREKLTVSDIQKYEISNVCLSFLNLELK